MGQCVHLYSSEVHSLDLQTDHQILPWSWFIDPPWRSTRAITNASLTFCLQCLILSPDDGPWPKYRVVLLIKNMQWKRPELFVVCCGGGGIIKAITIIKYVTNIFSLGVIRLRSNAWVAITITSCDGPTRPTLANAGKNAGCRFSLPRSSGYC